MPLFQPNLFQTDVFQQVIVIGGPPPEAVAVEPEPEAVAVTD